MVKKKKGKEKRPPRLAREHARYLINPPPLPHAHPKDPPYKVHFYWLYTFGQHTPLATPLDDITNDMGVSDLSADATACVARLGIFLGSAVHVSEQVFCGLRSVSFGVRVEQAGEVVYMPTGETDERLPLYGSQSQYQIPISIDYSVTLLTYPLR